MDQKDQGPRDGEEWSFSVHFCFLLYVKLMANLILGDEGRAWSMPSGDSGSPRKEKQLSGSGGCRLFLLKRFREILGRCSR